ncbi:lysine exporter LysO family protein [Metallumcola ferriviriculae]|uniref:Lysine exporter LysO family protein n=1 Tax=Metallumcola ferriviriculae TaxID=3039180 RepID=A0AAU0UQW3_9FIRM|nr:lysine exporter LysO family protein [Desulfitibacteraceae bacterium MK1]
MTLLVLAAVIGGIVSGVFLPPSSVGLLDNLTTVALTILLVGIGIDLGQNKDTILKDLKKLGWHILYIPILVALGSILGTAVSGVIIGIPLNEAAAIGAGFGWYSLSGVLLAKLHSVETGALAFLTNVSREVIALLLIPLIANRFGFLTSIAPGGATTMDTTLPLIAKSTDRNTAVIAFVNGLVLSALVPILVPLLIHL